MYTSMYLASKYLNNTVSNAGFYLFWYFGFQVIYVGLKYAPWTQVAQQIGDGNRMFATSAVPDMMPHILFLADTLRFVLGTVLGCI